MDPYSAAMNSLSHMKEISQIKRKEVTSQKERQIESTSQLVGGLTSHADLREAEVEKM